MTIETERLLLRLLDPEELRLWCDDLPTLENALGCTYMAEPMKGMFRDIVRGQLTATLADPEGCAWHSFWFIIRKSDRVVIGSADFKDVPDDKGEVELGYGLGSRFEHCGYMTEAAGAMCRWALSQPGVDAVIAETDLDGRASQRVLERCGFVEYRRDSTSWWRLFQSAADASRPMFPIR